MRGIIEVLYRARPLGVQSKIVSTMLCCQQNKIYGEGQLTYWLDGFYLNKVIPKMFLSFV